VLPVLLACHDRVPAVDSSAISLDQLEGGASSSEVKLVPAVTPSVARRRAFFKVLLCLFACGVVVAAVLVSLKIVAMQRASSDSSSGGGAAYSAEMANLRASNWYVRAQPKYVHNLTLPVRLQWNENFGYCGSTAMISAGMNFGQANMENNTMFRGELGGFGEGSEGNESSCFCIVSFCFVAPGTYASMWDTRHLASNGTKQHLQSSQLLLGVNDYFAAHTQKLTTDLWDYSDLDVKHFFTWIKKHVLLNHVVILGVFENGGIFDFKGGDSDYDHIVPVTGWGSNKPLNDPAYYEDDVLYLSDNGLYTPVRDDLSVYHISATLGEFARTRKTANDAKTARVYSINSNPTRKSPNYGIAVTGIADEAGDCMPLRITSDRTYEKPAIKEGSDTRPTPMSQTLTVHVSGLTVDEEYVLYKYEKFAKVPTSKFNANAANAAAKFDFKATSTTYNKDFTVKTDEQVVFRVVRKSAP
jgi:hypothetical protein